MKMVLITFILSFVFCVLTAPPGLVCYITLTDYEVNQLTWTNIDRELKTLKVEHPEIVKAQILLETGSLSSRFCREQNNLMGMKHARKRETTSVGQFNSMAVYRSWQESLRDYALWQRKYYKGGDYFRFLSRCGYAEDPYYQYKLKKLSGVL